MVSCKKQIKKKKKKKEIPAVVDRKKEKRGYELNGLKWIGLDCRKEREREGAIAIFVIKRKV